jgi:hypothetical protein
MEMGFAPSSLAAPGLPAMQDAPIRALDWHALKSRFVAAHALRREWASSLKGEISGGSFVDAGGKALASLRESSRVVNLTASANGKDHAGIEDIVTGTPNADDRGNV